MTDDMRYKFYTNMNKHIKATNMHNSNQKSKKGGAFTSRGTKGRPLGVPTLRPTSIDPWKGLERSRIG